MRSHGTGGRLFLILLIAALNYARPVLLPVTTAGVIGLMLGPLSSRADRAGVPLLVIISHVFPKSSLSLPV